VEIPNHQKQILAEMHRLSNVVKLRGTSRNTTLVPDALTNWIMTMQVPSVNFTMRNKFPEDLHDLLHGNASLTVLGHSWLAQDASPQFQPSEKSHINA
jgi:hypothetical protein